MTYREVQWIKYQMSLKRITQNDIAYNAGCSQPMVSQVIQGRKRSANVYMALIQALGYSSFEKLLADCRKLENVYGKMDFNKNFV